MDHGNMDHGDMCSMNVRLPICASKPNLTNSRCSSLGRQRTYASYFAAGTSATHSHSSYRLSLSSSSAPATKPCANSHAATKQQRPSEPKPPFRVSLAQKLLMKTTYEFFFLSSEHKANILYFFLLNIGAFFRGPNLLQPIPL
jgi:hypothetical protein